MSAKVILTLCMAVFGTVPLFIRLIPMTSAEIALWRAVLAAVSLLLYLIIRKQPLNIKAYKKQAGYLLLSGAFMGINWVALFRAYQLTSVSLATLIYYTAPLLVTLASVMIFRERITRSQIFCIGAAALGLGLIINPKGAAAIDQAEGMLYAFVAALFYASVIMINRFIKNVPSVTRTLLQFAAAIAVLVPYVLISGNRQTDNPGMSGVLSLLVLGIIHTGLVYCLYFNAIQKLQGREIALLSYIDPLMAVTLSALLLEEKLTFIQIVGGMIILLFTFLSERQNRRLAQYVADKN